MTSKRVRLRTARREILHDLVEYLEGGRLTSNPDQVTAIESLVAEFRRRGSLPSQVVPPGQQALPGMRMFTIALSSDGDLNG